MQHRLSVRGVSLIEFLGASMIATVVGGAMILLMSGMREAYQTHLAFQQLSGYLDAASTTLRNDIWAATASCQTTCPAGVTTAGIWLALDIPKVDATTGQITTGWGTGPDVRYVLDQTDALNIQLKRQVYNEGTSSWSAAWSVAQYLLLPPSPSNPGTKATVTNNLVNLELWVSRTINGRTYPRQMINLAYRSQVPS